MTTGIYRTVYGEAFAVPADDTPDIGTVPNGAVAYIDQARIANQLTPRQLADQAQLPGNIVAAILADSRQPTPGQIRKLCAALGIDTPTGES